MNTALIRELVLAECQASQNVFGPCFFDEHLAVVAHYGSCLAARLEADPEIVELAAYLHDISAIRDVGTLPEHGRLSAQLAREILAGHGYAPEVIEAVARCCASHANPVQMGRGSPEEICLSNADAIAQIVRPVYWSHVVFGVRQLGFENGRQWLLNRIESNWSNLIGPARDLVGDRYMLIKTVFSQ